MGFLMFFPHKKKNGPKNPPFWGFLLGKRRLWTSSMRWMASSVSKRSASTSSNEAMEIRKDTEFSRAFLLPKNVVLFLDYFWIMDGIPMKTSHIRSADSLRCFSKTAKKMLKKSCHLLGLDKFWVDQALKTSTAGFWQSVAMGNDACSAGIRYESLHCFPAWIPSKCLELPYNFAVKRLSCKHRWVSYSHWG